MQETHGEAEPEDAVPEGCEKGSQDEGPELFLASRMATPVPPVRSVVGKVLPYVAAGVWPFVWVWIEFVRLDDARTMSTMCDEAGCALESHVYLKHSMGWAIPLALASMAVMAGLIYLRRYMRARRRMTPPSDAPVNRFLVAGLFVAICTIAFLVGILRGAIISRFGH